MIHNVSSFFRKEIHSYDDVFQMILTKMDPLKNEFSNRGSDVDLSKIKICVFFSCDVIDFVTYFKFPKCRVSTGNVILKSFPPPPVLVLTSLFQQIKFLLKMLT